MRGRNKGSNVSISIAVALVIYFIIRPIVTGSPGYNGSATYATLFEDTLPILLVLAEVVSLLMGLGKR